MFEYQLKISYFFVRPDNPFSQRLNTSSVNYKLECARRYSIDGNGYKYLPENPSTTVVCCSLRVNFHCSFTVYAAGFRESYETFTVQSDD